MTGEADHQHDALDGGRLPVAVKLRPYVSAAGNYYLAGRDAAGRLVLVLERHRADADGTTHHVCIAPPRAKLPGEAAA